MGIGVAVEVSVGVAVADAVGEGVGVSVGEFVLVGLGVSVLGRSACNVVVGFGEAVLAGASPVRLG